MEPRKIMLIGGGLMLLAVVALMAKSFFSAAPAAVMPMPVQAGGPEVLVATRTLPAGTILTPDAFRYQPWPSELIDKAYYLKSEGQQSLAGTVVRLPIAAGQPLTQGSVVKPGDRGFLAAALGPGMRAVTITVSAQSGVAGFVFPGDRIDLLLTQSVAGGGEGQPLRATETIVRNLRVLASDQRTDKAVDDNGKTEVTTASTVTLEATPKLAEKIAVAETIGTLSLSLRSLSDDRMELERQIADGEVNLPDTGNPAEDKKLLAEASSRPVDADATFTTGGQVSRFQRNSVPGNSAPAPTPAAAPTGPARPRGPLVTVARGQAITVTPVAGVL